MGDTLTENISACFKECNILREQVARLMAENERLKGGQGEAVAEVILLSVGAIAVILKGHEDIPEGTKLYASQPAPVSVVLPERQFGGPYQDGWNACLDKVKEMNQ